MGPKHIWWRFFDLSIVGKCYLAGFFLLLAAAPITMSGLFLSFLVGYPPPSQIPALVNLGPPETVPLVPVESRTEQLYPALVRPRAGKSDIATATEQSAPRDESLPQQSVIPPSFNSISEAQAVPAPIQAALPPENSIVPAQPTTPTLSSADTTSPSAEVARGQSAPDSFDNPTHENPISPATGPSPIHVAAIPTKDAAGKGPLDPSSDRSPSLLVPGNTDVSSKQSAGSDAGRAVSPKISCTEVSEPFELRVCNSKQQSTKDAFVEVAVRNTAPLTKLEFIDTEKHLVHIIEARVPSTQNSENNAQWRQMRFSVNQLFGLAGRTLAGAIALKISATDATGKVARLSMPRSYITN